MTRPRTSDLGRLYGRLGGGMENFTSEALAIAIENDARPMAHALANMDWLAQATAPFDFADVTEIQAKTQFFLGSDGSASPGLERGYLDLVLYCSVEPDSTRETVWVEVKVDAPETIRAFGEATRGQLEIYEDHRSHEKWRSIRPRLMTLSRWQVKPTVPALLWERLMDSVDATVDPHLSWVDLQKFLREKFIALPARSESDDAMVGSLAEILWAIQPVISEHWPTEAGWDRLAWLTPSALSNNIDWHLEKDRRLLTSAGPLLYGLVTREGQRFWSVSLTTGLSRWRFDRAQLVDNSTASALPQRWERSTAPGTVFECVEPFDRTADVSNHVAWLTGCFDDLATCKVLEAARSIGG